jgi:hypothetical protein
MYIRVRTFHTQFLRFSFLDLKFLLEQNFFVSLFIFCGLSYDAVSSSDCLVPNGKTIHEWRNGKDLEGTGSGLIEVLYRDLPIGAKENY